MAVFLMLVGFALFAIEPSFGIPILLAAAMFSFWSWHDRSKQRQMKIHAHQ